MVILVVINMINFIKRKIKWVLIITGILGVVLAGGTDILVVTEVEKLDVINTVQIQELSKGHYKHIPRTYIENNDYQVDEYESPSGEVGYMITLFKDVDGFESKKIIDYGFSNRSSDWTTKQITATST